MNWTSPEILASPIEYLKGVGPQRAVILRKELGISSFGDLLECYPYRHLDKSQIAAIADINAQTEFIQVAGYLGSLELVGTGRGKRLVSTLKDASGILQLVWFQSISWMQKNLQPGFRYRAFGRIGFYNGEPQLTHPELEKWDEIKQDTTPLQPIYPSTEKLKSHSLGGRQIAKLTQQLLSQLKERDLRSSYPPIFAWQTGSSPDFRRSSPSISPSQPRGTSGLFTGSNLKNSLSTRSGQA